MRRQSNLATARTGGRLSKYLTTLAAVSVCVCKGVDAGIFSKDGGEGALKEPSNHQMSIPLSPHRRFTANMSYVKLPHEEKAAAVSGELNEALFEAEVKERASPWSAWHMSSSANSAPLRDLPDTLDHQPKGIQAWETSVKNYFLTHKGSYEVGLSPEVRMKAEGIALKAAEDPKLYPLGLRSIHTSHGNLEPPFDPDHYSYKIKLTTPHDQVAIVPEIDRARMEYFGEPNMPIVTMRWKNNYDALPEPSSIAIRKQIDLPDDGSDMTVEIEVKNPHASSYGKKYKVKLIQKFPPVPMLKYIEGLDEFGDSLLVEPIATEDSGIYNVYCNPRASKVSIIPGCNTDSWAKLNGGSVSNGKSVSIRRELNHHTQVVEVTCGKGGLVGKQQERKYALLVKSDWPLSEIPIPRLIVDDVGRECIFDERVHQFNCPDPKTSSHKTRMVAFNEPSVKYTIQNSKRTTNVRLLNKMASIPFTYSSGLKVVAEAGRFTQEWPITFSGAVMPSLMQMFGWILSISLIVLLLALLCVIGFSSMCGLGIPMGATEIAAGLTLIVQYFIFANFMRGSTALTEMITPLKWVTMFWPLPWHVGDSLRRRRLLEIKSFASAYGLELWGDSSLGDVTDIRNACGCLFWCSMIFLGLVVLHGLAELKFKVMESNYTLPHRLRFGNWHSRCLHWLAFPHCTAAAMVLAADITTTFWKCVAGFVIFVYVAWIGYVFFAVHAAVSGQQVCWVWNSSVREDGELEDESGYWSDVICNQVLTQPVNRSLCKGFFPWKWISTVGDIEPVAVNQAVFDRTRLADDVYAPNHLPRAHKEATYPLAKNPKAVEVIRARSPHCPCKGQRLVCGLLRTQWLDVLFTFESLTKFVSQVHHDSGRAVICPLTVKTAQLSGPLASGRLAFFYDGARVPFIRIADTIIRILLGCFVGTALASEGYKIDTAMFALVAAVSCGLLAYVAMTRPYSRKHENWGIVGMLGVISCSALSFCYYAARRRDPSGLADFFLWLVAGCCFLLSAYASIVTFSVFSALVCPPLEETRFLEKLANCSVTISDHHNGWAVDMPGYSRYGARDLKAQCTMTSGKRVHVSMFPSGEEPNFEFSVPEIKHACRTGSLTPPVLSVFAPHAESALGYRHHNVAERAAIHEEVARFLAADASTYPISDEIAKHVCHQIEMKSKGKAILSITIIPPKQMDHTSISTSSRRRRSASSSARGGESQSMSRRH